MLNGQIEFDYNNMMVSHIGKEHGLEESELAKLQESFAAVHTAIQSGSGAGSDYLGFLSLPEDVAPQIPRIQEVANQIADSSDIHLVLGIGGSYLGGRALFEALCHPYHNQLERSRRGQRPRLFFEGNNLDTDALMALLDLLPEGKPASLAERWSVNVVSKSGGTLETAVTFRVLRQLAESAYGDQAAQYIVATTDAKAGKLKKLADAKGYPQFVIPDDVGGRYSILTPVGLLPAAVAGIDIKQLVQGAADMRAACQSDQIQDNPAYLYAALQHLSWQAGRSISVMNIWDKALEYVGFWYDQLCAESLGKDGKGRIPITGVCTRDLHSRGQELQDGPHNTVITNLIVAQMQRKLELQSDPDNADELNYLNGKSMHEMLNKAHDGTNYAYARDGRPSMNFKLKERSAYNLGALFYLFELSTVAEGYLMQINPLNQPGVESYKNFMFGLLGREDKREYREEFESRPANDKRFQA